MLKSYILSIFSNFKTEFCQSFPKWLSHFLTSGQSAQNFPVLLSKSPTPHHGFFIHIVGDCSWYVLAIAMLYRRNRARRALEMRWRGCIFISQGRLDRPPLFSTFCLSSSLILLFSSLCLPSLSSCCSFKHHCLLLQLESVARIHSNLLPLLWPHFLYCGLFSSAILPLSPFLWWPYRRWMAIRGMNALVRVHCPE